MTSHKNQVKVLLNIMLAINLNTGIPKCDNLLNQLTFT